MSHTVERDWVTDAGLRAACILITGRHRCGYVAVPPGHPLHGVEYHKETDAIDMDFDAAEVGQKSAIIALTAAVGSAGGGIRHSPDIAFDVHGGLTYSGGDGQYPVEGDEWWFGFDCAHYGDGSLNPLMAGFLDGPVRSEEYVVAECERLARQITACVPSKVENQP